jgi:VWFA-related protein
MNVRALNSATKWEFPALRAMERALQLTRMEARPQGLLYPSERYVGWKGSTKMKALQFLVVLVIAILVASVSIAGQDEAPVRIGTDVVSVNVAINDASGKPVKGLTRSQFQIFDDSLEQDIAYFSSGGAGGVTFGIVYDMHPTTADRTRAVINGLREFIRGLPPADNLFLVAFNERGCLTSEIIPDADQLERHLALPENREPRSLYDALYKAVAKLREQKNQKRALLIITDAADHSSRRRYNEVESELRSFDVQVYAIAFDPTLNRFNDYIELSGKAEGPVPMSSDATPSDRAALNSITLRSGGTTYPSSLEDPSNILRITRDISRGVHDLYTLSFYPTRAPDGGRHNIRVGLKGVPGSKKFVLTYRPTYQSPMAAKSQ